jgi:serine/threonine-protein kinase
MVVAILIVVGIIASIVAGLLLFGKSDPGTVHFATVPSKVDVSVNGQPLESKTSPFVIAELPSGAPHTIAVSSDGYRPWTSRVELQPGQTLQLPTVNLEKIESGFAVDSVPPGASVLVDGERLGVTPVRLAALTPGEHKVRLELEGFAAWDSVLLVSTGTVLPLQAVNLQPLAAEPVTPPARGRSSAAESSTTSGEPGAEPRRREPRAQASEGAAAAEPTAPPEPEVDEEEEAEEVAEPAAAPVSSATGSGTLRVNSRPWSQVFVDGKLIGVTPQRAISLPAGTHTLLLVNEEFSIRKTVQVEIKPGEITTQVLTLM